MINIAAEKSFENKIKQWLESEGIYPFGTPEDQMTVPPIGYWEKRFGGGKFSKNGLPDMHICILGKSIECEVKAENGHPSELQKFMIRQINRSKGFGVVVKPTQFDEFVRMIKCVIFNDTDQAREICKKINTLWGI